MWCKMAKIDERIAIALEGIHKELKRLNDTNPATKAQPKKNDNKKNLEPDPSKFIWGGIHDKTKREIGNYLSISLVAYVSYLTLVRH